MVGNVGNFKISLMVSIEVPIHKYSSGPQNYNPGFVVGALFYSSLVLLRGRYILTTQTADEGIDAASSRLIRDACGEQLLSISWGRS